MRQASPLRRTAGLALAAALAASVAARPALAADPPAANPSAAVDALLAPYARQDAPSLSVGVYAGGKVAYSRVVGDANLEFAQPADASTLYDVASVSKQFTAFAVALLERDGKIDPRADIHRYLPELPPYGATVTVSDLIHHTSGFRDSNILLDLAQRDPGDHIRHTQVMHMVASQRTLRYAPGSEFSYTNTGYELLAEIVARVSGRSFRQFTTERIFKPLGMTHSFFRDDVSAVIPGWADSYAPKPGGGWRRSVYSAEAVGSTGLATTSDDLLKWVANFDHPVLGDQALLDEITTPGALRSGVPINYGYGLWRQSFAGRDAITHNGAIAAYRSVLVWLPKERLGVVVLANMPADVEALAGKVIEAYLGKAPPGPTLHKEDAAPIHPSAAELDRLTGRYIPHGLWSVDMVREGDKLVWTSTTLPRAEITLRERDIFTRGQGDAARWYHFLRDPAGRVTGFQLISELGAANSGDIFRRAPMYSAPPAALKAFVGDYHSPDVDTTYSVFIKDHHLAARAIWSAKDANLVSVAPDRFDADTIGLGVLAARRDAAGRVVALDIVAGGLSGLTLDRLPPRARERHEHHDDDHHDEHHRKPRDGDRR